MAEGRLAGMRAEHWKRAGDEALRGGRGGRARELYGRCLEARGAPPGAPAGEPRGAPALWGGEAAVRGNRALALSRGGRHAEALAEADRAAELRPDWVKAHWRRHAALHGLGRFPEALQALREAWRAEEGAPETARALRRTAGRLTRQQLGVEVQTEVEALQAAGRIPAPRIEAVSPEEMTEAWFRIVKEDHDEELSRAGERGGPAAHPVGGAYCRKVLRWCLAPMSPAEALLERARCHNRAACYLQARADARAALRLAGSEGAVEGDGAGEGDRAAGDGAGPLPGTPAFRAAVLVQLGASFMCGTVDEVHEDQDKKEGVKAIARAADLQPHDERISYALMNAGQRLSQEEMSLVLQDLYHTESLEGGRAVTGDAGSAAQPAFCVVASVHFGGEATLGRFNARARETLQRAVADAAALPKIRVVIAGAGMEAPTPDSEPVLAVRLRIHTGPDVLRAKELRDVISGGGAGAAAAFGGAELEATLGPLLPGLARAEIEDATPRGVTGSSGDSAGGLSGDEATVAASGDDCALVLPARPKTDLELPYRMYRLVRADGAEVERKDKHAFQFSRIHYDRQALDDDVFVQPGDGACRWRQSSSEVVVILPEVRRGEVAPRDLGVVFETHRLEVRHLRTGQVFLEGTLERGIIAEDSVWDLEGGDHGLVLYLRKMNLELLSQPGSHGESWWPRLFRHHGEIAWDDYDKDYSDLPEPVMARHLLNESQTQATNQLESAEKKTREALQERDDARRRQRQERLNVLRTGNYKTWVALDRANPPSYAFQAAQPQLADRFGK